MIGPGKIGNTLPIRPKRTNNVAIRIKIKSMGIFLFDDSLTISLRSFTKKRNLDFNKGFFRVDNLMLC